jgi:hypothetical protein
MVMIATVTVTDGVRGTSYSGPGDCNDLGSGDSKLQRLCLRRVEPAQQIVFFGLHRMWAIHCNAQD